MAAVRMGWLKSLIARDVLDAEPRKNTREAEQLSVEDAQWLAKLKVRDSSHTNESLHTWFKSLNLDQVELLKSFDVRSTHDADKVMTVAKALFGDRIADAGQPEHRDFVRKIALTMKGETLAIASALVRSPDLGVEDRKTEMKRLLNESAFQDYSGDLMRNIKDGNLSSPHVRDFIQVAILNVGANIKSGQPNTSDVLSYLSADDLVTHARSGRFMDPHGLAEMEPADILENDQPDGRNRTLEISYEI